MSDGEYSLWSKAQTSQVASQRDTLRAKITQNRAILQSKLSSHAHFIRSQTASLLQKKSEEIREERENRTIAVQRSRLIMTASIRSNAEMVRSRKQEAAGMVRSWSLQAKTRTSSPTNC
jgi:CHASE1-domain containing sensor protein